jgi:2-desacetyl-2-hydroxyethyl bacteriochlorophyllide A dehydrogenase
MNTQAIVMSGKRDIEVCSLPVPDDPPLGGAILRVTANGLCGSDWDLFDGVLAKIMPLEFPLVPGHEIVGEIAAIDLDAAKAWNVEEGDRVIVESGARCGECRECTSGRAFCESRFNYSLTPLALEPGLWGGMSQYMVLRPGSVVMKIADHVNDLDAALFNPFGNSIHWTAEIGGVGPGDRVLVLGPGQRGLGCAMSAREEGAEQVIVTGTARDGHKLRLAERFGASHTLNVDEVDTVEAVHEITDGLGVDVVIDTTPITHAPIFDGLKALRPGGTLVVAGIKGRPIEGLYLETLLQRELTIRGAQATTVNSVRRALDVIEGGRYPVAELHTHTVGLDQVEEALKVLGGEVPGEPIHITVVP